MKNFIVRCLIVSLLVATIFAQPPASTTDQAEAEKTKLEREKKAWALLEVIIAAANALKLPENRAYVQATAADLLWTKDEPRARALFQEAAGTLAQLLSGIESDDPNYYNRIQAPTQLRQQILQMIAQRDAQLALTVLRATRPPEPPEQARNGYSPEANLESQLAVQAVRSDPKRALQMAEESLEKGYSHGVLDTISQLQAKDPEAARKLASKLVTKLKSEDLAKNPQASGIAGSVLFLMNNPPNAQIEGASKQALFSEQDKKEFIESIVATTLKGYNTSAEGGAHQLGYVLKETMQLVEKYAPTQALALRRKLPAPAAPAPVQNKAFEELQQLQQKGSVEQLLAFAKTAAPEISNQAYQQAAWKAINQGETERAREIINTYVPPSQRRSMQTSLDLTLLSRAAAEGKLEETRRELARIQPPERKITYWLEMVNIIIGKGDKETALQLLQEARTMMGTVANNAEQFNAQLQLIRGFAQLEPAQAVGMMEPLITQLNSLTAAAEVLDGFEQRNGFQQGEMRLQSGGGMITQLLQQFAETLALVASSEFERSQTILDRFERDEVRLLVHLAIVQKLLRSAPDAEGFGENQKGEYANRAAAAAARPINTQAMKKSG